MSDLTTKPCHKCGQTAGQIINAQEQRRVGWWCQSCGNFDDAIRRERVLADRDMTPPASQGVKGLTLAATGIARLGDQGIYLIRAANERGV